VQNRRKSRHKKQYDLFEGRFKKEIII
jgi:hypothetical protein